MNPLTLMFTHEGKINRSQWWLGQLYCILTGIILAFILHVNIPHTFNLFEIFSLHNVSVGGALGIFLIYIHMQINIKRWHDIHKSGWWSILCAIPPISYILCIFVLGMMKSKEVSD